MSLPEMLVKIKDTNAPMDTLAKKYYASIGKFKIEIPKGFQTDYASIPSVLIPFFLNYEKNYQKEAVIHDWLYWSQIYPRKTADKILNDALTIGGMPRFKRWLMYRAVRMFGWLAWNENRRQKNIAGIDYKIKGSYDD